MSTFLKEFVLATDERWQEVDILIAKAKDVQDRDVKLYHVLCRSVIVLLVAHLEGFTKDLVKNIIRDLNCNCDFSSLPIAIKRTYCKKYLGNNQGGKSNSYNNGLSKLINKFEEIECDISNEPFLFTTNRNPNSNTIKIIFNNFGISNVFDYLFESKLEEMFSCTLSEIQKQAEELRGHIFVGTENFPYSMNCEEFGLDKKKAKIKTLWEDFLEQINQNRHSIAHGNEFGNSYNINELSVAKSKIIITQYALILILASKVIGGETERNK